MNVATNNQQQFGRRDQQLIVLLICEILVYISTNLLYSINITYSAITSYDVKSLERLRIEGFISYFSTPFLIIINNCIPFYLYLMVSSKFRTDVKIFLMSFWRCSRQDLEQQTAGGQRTNASGSTAGRQGRSTKPL